MVIVKSIILLILINILILISISDLHLNIFFNILNKLVNLNLETANSYFKLLNFNLNVNSRF